ncbi:ABC transporter permease [Paraburkholderia sp. GAS42]|uniref:ABC transporter permease n=1 Tax=Paraburkholderia sp. GAS42 TaxID=3035135 RepID=UPI003D1EBE4E
MNQGLQNLSLWDVGIAALLIVVNGAVSVVLKLDLERKLAWAAVRTIVQLLAIGYVLGWVFAYDRWFVVLPLMILMTLIAGFAGADRGLRTYAGQRADSIMSIWVSSWLVAAVGLFVVIRIHPWYEPQYAIPILGMILGNTLTGVSLGIERMTEELTARRDRVDMALALGATRWEAAQGPARQAARAGMIPTLNQMAVVGVVSLPGMMTGQVLAGQSPLQAVRYQIVIMFLIAASSALGTVGAVLLTYRRLFSAEHRFLASRLIERSPRSGR